jgi:hypothetical protein
LEIEAASSRSSWSEVKYVVCQKTVLVAAISFVAPLHVYSTTEAEAVGCAHTSEPATTPAIAAARTPRFKNFLMLIPPTRCRHRLGVRIQGM